MRAVTEFWLIRHAPADTQGRVTGRRDVGLLPINRAPLALAFDGIAVSPARRCVQTAGLLLPGQPLHPDARLWEQDFGRWEGADPAAVLDLGPLPPPALAAHRPEGGESFADLCARSWPALEALATGGRVAVIAHAGTVRAALSLALGHVPAGLAFQIAPLSLTRLTATPGGWSIDMVNGALP